DRPCAAGGSPRRRAPRRSCADRQGATARALWDRVRTSSLLTYGRRARVDETAQPFGELGTRLPIRRESLDSGAGERMVQHLAQDLGGRGGHLATEPRGG